MREMRTDKAGRPAHAEGLFTAYGDSMCPAKRMLWCDVCRYSVEREIGRKSLVVVQASCIDGRRLNAERGGRSRV